MTAEELINQEGYHFLNCKNDVENLMIAYAKMHVKKALEAASENSFTDYDDDNNIIIDKNSILNAYPESNII